VNRRRTAAVIENIVARTELDLGEVDQAVRRLRALIARERRVLGGILELSYAMLSRGLILQGSLEEARDALAELFRHARMTDGERFPNWAYTCPALALGEQRLEAAARLMGFVAAESKRDGIADQPSRERDTLLAVLAERLEAPTLQRLMAEGATLDREAMFALTLDRAAGKPETARETA
jgi:hypothetical protein